MRIHHLNCGTMCPYGASWIQGHGGVFKTARLVCHCLLIESNDGLILVDTGLGMRDVEHGRERLGGPFLAVARPKLDPNETAARQVERLGFRTDDVRHIVVTHLDLDHAGGLSDFPKADVHVLDREHSAAMQLLTLAERGRYRSAQWAHRPAWKIHGIDGERWFDFDGVRTVAPEVGVDVLLVPLHGHTRGHCGVAVRTESTWLLHCGDAYFHRDEMATPVRECPPGLAVFQRLVAIDDGVRLHNQQRLRELKHARDGEIRLFSAHDPNEFDQLREASPPRA